MADDHNHSSHRVPAHPIIIAPHPPPVPNRLFPNLVSWVYKGKRARERRTIQTSESDPRQTKPYSVDECFLWLVLPVALSESSHWWLEAGMASGLVVIFNLSRRRPQFSEQEHRR